MAETKKKKRDGKTERNDQSHRWNRENGTGKKIVQAKKVKYSIEPKYIKKTDGTTDRRR